MLKAHIIYMCLKYIFYKLRKSPWEFLSFFPYNCNWASRILSTIRVSGFHFLFAASIIGMVKNGYNVTGVIKVVSHYRFKRKKKLMLGRTWR